MPEATKKKKSPPKAQDDTPDKGRRDVPPHSNENVRDCFQWDSSKPSKPVPEDGEFGDGKPYHHKFIIRKADIGKSRDMGYNIPPPVQHKHKDNESAGEALRGWPGTQAERGWHQQVDARPPGSAGNERTTPNQGPPHSAHGARQSPPPRTAGSERATPSASRYDSAPQVPGDRSPAFPPSRPDILSPGKPPERECRSFESYPTPPFINEGPPPADELPPTRPSNVPSITPPQCMDEHEANCVRFQEQQEDLTDEKNMSNIMAHKYIDGVPEAPKMKPKKNMSDADKKIVENMANRPKKVKPCPKVEVKQPKQFDSTLQGRRAWRS